MLKQLQDASLEDGALDEACHKMQELVSAAALPESILSDAGRFALPPPSMHAASRVS